MSHTNQDGTIVLNTPEDIHFARVCALRGAVKLEMLGLRHSSGTSAAQAARKLLGLGKVSRAKVLAHLNDEIEFLKAQKEAAK